MIMGHPTCSLGEDEVEGEEHDDDCDGEGGGFLVPGEVAFYGFGSEGVDEAYEFGLGAGLGGERNGDGDDEVGGEGEDGGPEVLCHVAGVVVDDVNPAAVDAGSGIGWDGESVVDECGEGSGDEAGEGAVAGGALPEHAEQEGGEERGVDDGEDELESVHDVVEVGDGVGCPDGEDDATDGRHATHPEVVGVAGFLVDVGLVYVVGPDGVEGGDVASHSGHEAGEERGEAEAEDSCGEEVEEHDGDGEVVVVDGIALVVEDGLAAEGVGLEGDDAVGVLFG